MRLTWHNNNIKERRHRSNKEFHKFYCNFKYLWMQYFFLSGKGWVNAFDAHHLASMNAPHLYIFRVCNWNFILKRINIIFPIFSCYFNSRIKIYFRKQDGYTSTIIEGSVQWLKKLVLMQSKKIFFNKIKNKEKIFALEFFSFLSEWNLGKISRKKGNWKREKKFRIQFCSYVVEAFIAKDTKRRSGGWWREASLSKYR